MCREMKEMPFLRQVVRKYSLKYGVSTSGKSADFGSAIPRFESWHPSQYYFKKIMTQTVSSKLCSVYSL